MIDPRHINIILAAIHKSKAGEVKDASGLHFDPYAMWDYWDIAEEAAREISDLKK
jgi:hypothetical protein